MPELRRWTEMQRRLRLPKQHVQGRWDLRHVITVSVTFRVAECKSVVCSFSKPNWVTKYKSINNSQPQSVFPAVYVTKLTADREPDRKPIASPFCITYQRCMRRRHPKRSRIVSGLRWTTLPTM